MIEPIKPELTTKEQSLVEQSMEMFFDSLTFKFDELTSVRDFETKNDPTLTDELSKWVETKLKYNPVLSKKQIILYALNNDTSLFERMDLLTVINYVDDEILDLIFSIRDRTPNSISDYELMDLIRLNVDLFHTYVLNNINKCSEFIFSHRPFEIGLSTKKEIIDIVDKAFEEGDQNTIDKYLQSFSWDTERAGTSENYPILTTKRVKQLIEREMFDVVFQHIGKFFHGRLEISEEDTRKVAEHAPLKFVTRNLWHYGFETPQDLALKAFQESLKDLANDRNRKDGDWKSIVKFNEKFNVDDLIEKIEIMFGQSDGCLNLYFIGKKIEIGEKIEWVEKLLTKADASLVGIARLERAIANFTNKIFSNGLTDEDLEELLVNESLAIIFRKIIRYDYSTFGSSSADNFKKLIQNILEERKKGKHKEEVDDEIFSRVGIKPRVEKELKKNFKNDPQFVDAWNSLMIDFSDASYKRASFLHGSEELSILKVDLMSKLSWLREEIESFLQRDDRVGDKLLLDLNRILYTPLKSVEDLENFFLSVVSLRVSKRGKEFKELFAKVLSLLRTTFIYISYVKNQSLSTPRVLNLSYGDIGNTSKENISNLIEWVEQNLLEENFLFKRGILKKDESRRAIANLFRLGVLKNELLRMGGGAGKETINTEIIPSNDVFLEFSADIQDTCWKDKYPEGIRKLFPNIKSYTFVKNPNTKDVAVAGGFLTLDTINLETGKPTMVMRAFNPTQDFLSGVIIDEKTGEKKVTKGVNVESIFKMSVAYAKSIAKKRDMELAIVVDHSGGASTNRQPVFTYLEGLVNTKKIRRTRIPNNLPHSETNRRGRIETEEMEKWLRDPENLPTNFNGYDISTCTYSLEDFDTTENL